MFTALDEGTKAFNVDLLSDDKAYQYTFFMPVPGLRIDHHNVDWENLYAEDALLSIEDAGSLIEALESYPCCTTDKKGEDAGDPLNLVVIGELDDRAQRLDSLLPSFARFEVSSEADEGSEMLRLDLQSSLGASNSSRELLKVARIQRGDLEMELGLSLGTGD